MRDKSRDYGHPMSGPDLVRATTPRRDIHYIQCQCSAAHTFGNVTAYVQQWLLNLFPKETFRTIHVNSKIAHAQIKSTPQEFLKKAPPFFILRPRVEWNDDGKFLQGTSLIERKGDLYHTYGMTNLMEFFKDDKKEVAIKYQLNRQVINFDVILIFSTMMQQLNYAKYLRNAVRHNIPFNLETCLESYISPELLKVLADLTCHPMEENGSNVKFLSYLNSNSCYPITHKIQGSSNTEEYYRYYPVKIDSTISNFSVDEGSKVGQVADRYPISFTMRCEFYDTGFYYLFSEQLQDHALITVNNDDNYILPLFTDVITCRDLNLPEGWRLFAQPSCRLEDRNDTIDISSILNNSLIAAIEHHIERGIPISNFFHLRLRRQGQIMSEGKEYTFDPLNKKIHFIDCDTYFTYKIIIAINLEYINTLIKDIYQLK